MVKNICKETSWSTHINLPMIILGTPVRTDTNVHHALDTFNNQQRKLNNQDCIWTSTCISFSNQSNRLYVCVYTILLVSDCRSMKSYRIGRPPVGQIWPLLVNANHLLHVLKTGIIWHQIIKGRFVVFSNSIR